MGSRAVAVLARNAEAAQRVFGAQDGRTGVIYTRTGREFFSGDMGRELVARVTAVVEAAGLFDELASDWIALDTELLPWSAKAQGLLRSQYAQVGAAAGAALPVANAALQAALARGLDVGALADRTSSREANAAKYRDAYRAYCWSVEGLEGIEIAPFQILAAQGATFESRPHAWHMEMADRLVAAGGGLFRPTRRMPVDLGDPAAIEAATNWWLDMVGNGGEGMVVKPADNLDASRTSVAQPGVKVRGPEYLRIIYGPDYLDTESLAKLKGRSVGRKRSLAVREYAVGMEGLRRFADGEPLWRVHECAFAVLALESEPVDPRL